MYSPFRSTEYRGLPRPAVGRAVTQEQFEVTLDVGAAK
jgi:hypothetical protein